MNRLLLACLVLTPAAASQTWTVTSFGTSCGGTLQATVVQHANGAALRAGVTGADALKPALLVLGHQFATPVSLPGGCELLVDPRVTLHGRTSPNGDARFAFRLPPIVPLTFDLQALVVTLTPAGRIADTTNGLRVAGS